MRFLADNCFPGSAVVWLQEGGHDVVRAVDLGPDPGDQALMRLAAEQHRVLLTNDKDFGALVFRGGRTHAGLVRLPQVAPEQAIELMRLMLQRHAEDLDQGSVITVQSNRIRVTRPEQR